MGDTIDIRPVTGRIGAEIQGVDLARPIAAETAAELSEVLLAYQVLFFRDQNLDIEQQKRVTEIFGPLMKLPYIESIPDDPFVIAVLKQADETDVGVFGGDWHSDFSFLKAPPAGSILNAVEVPDFGGDTVWANQIAAYEALSDDLKDILRDRDAIHVGAPYGVKFAPEEATRSGRSIGMVRGDPGADEETAHPAVRIHRESGRKSLFLNPIYTVRLSGMSVEESRPVLEALYRHCVRPDFCCRFRWTPGAVTVWDNRTTLHYAVNDYDGHRRLLYRTAFADREPARAIQ